MVTEATLIQFAPGDRIRIVDSLPQKGQRGLILHRTPQDLHAYLVQLDRQHTEARVRRKAALGPR